MSRSSENWIVMLVRPWPESEVIWSIPAIVENCFSSGVATAAAMVSGLAPGSWAETWIVGNRRWAAKKPAAGGSSPVRKSGFRP